MGKEGEEGLKLGKLAENFCMRWQLCLVEGKPE